VQGSRNKLVFALALVAAIFLVYQPTLNNVFVHFDDPAYIVENSNVNSGLSGANFRWAFTTFEQGNWHPITWLWHQSVAEVVGINPRGYHLGSILLHAVNAVLLFLLLCRFPPGAADSEAGSRRLLLRALIVAALFALHPINVESVSWAAEQKSLLCMLFSLLAILEYERYVTDHSRTAFLSVVALFALALMSKPMAVTLPVLLLLLDYWPLERLDPAAADRASVMWRLLREKLPLFAMSAASSWVTIVAQHRGEAFKGLDHVRLPTRLENAIVSVALYLRRLVWPSDLTYLYPHRGANLPFAHLAIAATVLTVIALLLWRLRSHKPLIFGFGFFLVALLPVLGILQVGFQSMADRYAYLPFIGIFIALVWELDAVFDRSSLPAVTRLLIASLALSALTLVTVRTESYWHDSVSLFRRGHDLTRPPNVYIETNLAAALLEQGRPREAVEYLRNAESVSPGNFGSHFNVGYVLANIGERQGAIDELRNALEFPTTDEKRQRALALIEQLQSQTIQR
jgi:protein O-mannosyl-transferase